MVTSYRRSGAVRTSLTLLGQNIGNTISIVGYTFSVSYPVFFVAKSIWPRRRRPNQTSIKSSAMGLRPTDQPPKLVLRKNGRPLLKRPASGARRRRRFCVRPLAPTPAWRCSHWPLLHAGANTILVSCAVPRTCALASGAQFRTLLPLPVAWNDFSAAAIPLPSRPILCAKNALSTCTPSWC